MAQKLASWGMGKSPALDLHDLYFDSLAAEAYRRHAQVQRRPLPLREIVAAIQSRLAEAPLSVVALGCGDAEDEIALTRALRDVQTTPLSLDLLDLSQALLEAALQRAAALRERGVKVLALQADLLGLADIAPGLWPAGRRRLHLLLGSTFGSLEHELDLIKGLHAASGKRDLWLLEIEQRAGREPWLNEVPKTLSDWLCGVARRACPMPVAVELHAEVADSNSCTIEGSSGAVLRGSLRRGAEIRECVLLRRRRYDVERLERTLRNHGWQRCALVEDGDRCFLLLDHRG
jgi:hypothetical protein